MRFLLSLFVISILSGCGTSLPKFTEPDPSKMHVFRMRISSPIGVSASVSIHQNSTNSCLNFQDGFELPFKSNISGFGGPSKKLIGMPLPDTSGVRNIGEMYLPADDDITIYASFSNSNGMYQVNCRQSVKFSPKKNHDYQIDLVAGFPAKTSAKANSCQLTLSEIREVGTAKWELAEVTPITAVVVPGSPLWYLTCKK